jgi:hypothetical protein
MQKHDYVIFGQIRFGENPEQNASKIKKRGSLFEKSLNISNKNLTKNMFKLKPKVENPIDRVKFKFFIC